jgi:ferrochelatase
LVANLGTPEAPTAPAVRRFLAEFLWDPRIVEAPRWLWWLALHGLILRVRPARSAHAYRQIWTPEGSPLMLHSRAIASALEQELARDLDPVVALGMTYGAPSLPTALAQLREANVRRIIVLPLYPQYSATTTACVFDRVTRELQRWRWVPELRFIHGWHDEPAYIEALSAAIEEYWRACRLQPRGRLLFSFHGVPRRYLLAGDPYHCFCQKTARLVAARLGLRDDEWSVSFQSQVGREEWLRPYTDEWLIEWARRGGKHVSVVCPGFATDCLETLEEIALRNRDAFLKNGGETYHYVPALNAGSSQIALLAALVRRHAAGWTTAPAASEALAESRRRALQMGAAD